MFYDIFFPDFLSHDFMICDKSSESWFDKSVKIIVNHDFNVLLNHDFMICDKSSKSWFDKSVKIIVNHDFDDLLNHDFR